MASLTPNLPLLLGTVIALLFIGPTTNIAQKKETIQPKISNCEGMVTVLDSTGILYNQAKTDDDMVIILAGSKSLAFKSFDLARIDQVKRYLNKFYDIKANKVEFGISQSINSLSFVRIYVKGKLVGEIFTSRKGKLCRATNEVI